MENSVSFRPKHITSAEESQQLVLAHSAFWDMAVR